MFSSRLKSVVRQQGAKASATLQPYVCLPLDIEVCGALEAEPHAHTLCTDALVVCAREQSPTVISVEQALSLFMAREVVTFCSVRCTHAFSRLAISDSHKEGVQVDASKQMSFEELPPVLVLQLKRFAFDSEVGEYYKNTKRISFPKNLVIPPSLLSHAGVAPNPAERTYSLTSGALQLPGHM